MAHTLLIHFVSEEPFVAEVDELPKPTDQILICFSPRRRDGKEVETFLPEVGTVMIPWHRVTFIEVIPGAAAEEVVTFIRE
jgi:hypothetical protein